ncbi:MAG TPA: insulinase family protein, partial [Candidatus Paceibacterota bacterium]
TQAGIALWRLLVPKGHPNYAETTDESLRTLSTITSKKLAAYHSSTLDQSSLIFSIAGDIEIDSMFALAEKHFKKFPVRSIELPSFTPSTPSSAEKVIIPIEHKESVDYLVGIATGITQRHEDYPALLIGMNVLGAPNFSGRLMSTVREKEGLTYGVYANTSGFARHNDGALIVWAAFAPQMFDRGRAAVIREIKKLITRGATTDEIKKHSFMYLARKKTGLTTSSAYAALAHDLAADDLPLSHIDSFDKKIEKLTAADVNKALKKYLVPKLLSEAAAGPVEQNAFGR